MADLLAQPERAAEIIGGMITSRTKLISISHVSYITGAVLPVKEICEVAHRHGVLVLVDGAQSFAGMLTACRWLTGEVGADWAFARIRRLARMAWHALREIKGVTVLTPPDMAGLVTFQIDGMSPDDAVKALHAQGIVTRSVPDPASIRIATGFYVSEEEIGRMVSAAIGLAGAQSTRGLGPPKPGVMNS